MATFTRTETDLLGTPGSPSSVAAAGTATTAAVDLTGANAASGAMHATLIIGGTPPTSPPTVAFQESYDGTNYVNSVTYVCPNVASTTYVYPYAPTDPAVKKFRALITNGATTGITAYSQGNVLTVT